MFGKNKLKLGKVGGMFSSSKGQEQASNQHEGPSFGSAPPMNFRAPGGNTGAIPLEPPAPVNGSGYRPPPAQVENSNVSNQAFGFKPPQSGGFNFNPPAKFQPPQQNSAPPRFQPPQQNQKPAPVNGSGYQPPSAQINRAPQNQPSFGFQPPKAPSNDVGGKTALHTKKRHKNPKKRVPLNQLNAGSNKNVGPAPPANGSGFKPPGAQTFGGSSFKRSTNNTRGVPVPPPVNGSGFKPPAAATETKTFGPGSFKRNTETNKFSAPTFGTFAAPEANKRATPPSSNDEPFEQRNRSTTQNSNVSGNAKPAGWNAFSSSKSLNKEPTEITSSNKKWNSKRKTSNNKLPQLHFPAAGGTVKASKPKRKTAGNPVFSVNFKPLGDTKNAVAMALSGKGPSAPNMNQGSNAIVKEDLPKPKPLKADTNALSNMLGSRSNGPPPGIAGSAQGDMPSFQAPAPNPPTQMTFKAPAQTNFNAPASSFSQNNKPTPPVNSFNAPAANFDPAPMEQRNRSTTQNSNVSANSKPGGWNTFSSSKNIKEEPTEIGSSKKPWKTKRKTNNSKLPQLQPPSGAVKGSKPKRKTSGNPVFSVNFKSLGDTRSAIANALSGKGPSVPSQQPAFSGNQGFGNGGDAKPMFSGPVPAKKVDLPKPKPLKKDTSALTNMLMNRSNGPPPQATAPAPEPKPTFNAPAQSNFNPPAQSSFNAPAQPSFNAPAQSNFNAPAQPSFNAPTQSNFNPPAQSGFNAPAQSNFNAAPAAYAHDIREEDEWSGSDDNEEPNNFAIQQTFSAPAPPTQRKVPELPPKPFAPPASRPMPPPTTAAPSVVKPPKRRTFNNIGGMFSAIKGNHHKAEEVKSENETSQAEDTVKPPKRKSFNPFHLHQKKDKVAPPIPKRNPAPAAAVPLQNPQMKKMAKHDRNKNLRESIKGLQNLSSFWDTFGATNKKKQELNPFSDHFAGKKEIDTSNILGSKSDQRAEEAKAWTAKEIDKLVVVIQDFGTYDNSYNGTVITFGELFKIYENISDTLVFMLIKAKKKGKLNFDAGEMLLQGRDDHVVIVVPN